MTTQNYGSMTLVLDPPWHNTKISVPEYIKKVIHMYEASRIGDQECIITKILVDRRGPGEIVYDELCRTLGPIVGGLPIPMRRTHLDPL